MGDRDIHDLEIEELRRQVEAILEDAKDDAYEEADPIYDDEVVWCPIFGESFGVTRMTIAYSDDEMNLGQVRNLLDFSRDTMLNDYSGLKNVNYVSTIETIFSLEILKANNDVKVVLSFGENLPAFSKELECLKIGFDDLILVVLGGMEDAEILSEKGDTFKGVNEEFLLIIWCHCFPWHPNKTYWYEVLSLVRLCFNTMLVRSLRYELEKELVGELKPYTCYSFSQKVFSLKPCSIGTTIPYAEKNELDLRTSLFFQPEGNDGESVAIVVKTETQIEVIGAEHYLGFSSLMDHVVKTQVCVEDGKASKGSECSLRSKTARIQKSCINFKLMLVLIRVAKNYELYMDGKLWKSSFQCKKRHVFWSFLQGVMTVLMKTTQKV